jgi:hypothetical protein
MPMVSFAQTHDLATPIALFGLIFSATLLIQLFSAVI